MFGDVCVRTYVRVLLCVMLLACCRAGRGYSEITMGNSDSWITFVMKDDVARLLRSLRQMLDQL